MKTKLPAITAALVAAAALLTTGCSSQASDAKPTASATPDAAHTPAKAADGAKAFFAAVTSDKVAQINPASPDPAVFGDAVKHVDPASDANVLADTLGNLAALKVAAGSAPLELKIDESKIAVTGDTATIPASAIWIEQDRKKAANSDADAAALGHLEFKNGSWDVTFKKDAPASASPMASPSPTASK